MQKQNGKLARKRRVRAKISGTATRPRLSVHRSLTGMSAQLIDDAAGITIAAASTKEAKVGATMDGAAKLGALIAKKAADKKITSIVFDRNSYKYHGRIKALADAAREAGLQF